MDIASFSQLGIGVATLVILWVVIKYFIEALSKKDEYIQQVVKDFNLTINNHMDHETKAFNRLSLSLDKLVKGLKKNTDVMTDNTEILKNGKH